MLKYGSFRSTMKYEIAPYTPKLLEKKFHFFFSKYKNEWKEHIFWRQKNQKRDFYKNKKILKVYDIDVNKILASKKEPYGTNKSIKYFTGYNDDDIIRPLWIKLPQMIGHVKCFDSNKTMSFKVTDKTTLIKLY